MQDLGGFVKLRYLGHSAFEMTGKNGIKVLADPFISQNPSCPLSIKDLDPDIICITHAHIDHLGDAVELARRSNSYVITNYEISKFLKRNGINAIGLNYGASINFEGLEIRMLNALHSSSFDFDENLPYGGNPGSFLIDYKDDAKIFHAGDTGLFSDMRFVVGDIYKPDIALLPIGDIFTMGIDEAAIAAKWINPKIVVPMHYNSFPAIKQNPEEFRMLVEKESANLKVEILKPLDALNFTRNR